MKVTRQERFPIAPRAISPAALVRDGGTQRFGRGLCDEEQVPLQGTPEKTVSASVSSKGSSSPCKGRPKNTERAGVPSKGSSSSCKGRPRIRNARAFLRRGAAPLARDAREYGKRRRPFEGEKLPLHRTPENTESASVPSKGRSSPCIGRPRIRKAPASLRRGAAPLAWDARECGKSRRPFEGEKLPLHRTPENTESASVSSKGSSSPCIGRPRIRKAPASLRRGEAPLASDAREYRKRQRLFEGEQLPLHRTPENTESASVSSKGSSSSCMGRS